MPDFQADLPGPRSQIKKQLVILKNIAEWLDPRVQQIARRIGAEAVGGVCKPAPPGETQQRGVDKPVGDSPFQRRVGRAAARQVA